MHAEKENLYKSLIKLKTKEAENRCKLYKNKLTDVIRIAKKFYYKRLLIDNKTNVKGTWDVLNGILKKGFKKMTCPEYFVDAHGEYRTKNRVVNSFNNFFLNIGCDLASRIPDEQIEYNIDKIENNSNTIFLSAVSEKEVMDIVQKSKNNCSMDCYSINMAILKKVINNIKTPLTHICNQSLLNENCESYSTT